MVAGIVGFSGGEAVRCGAVQLCCRRLCLRGQGCVGMSRASGEVVQARVWRPGLWQLCCCGGPGKLAVLPRSRQASYTVPCPPAAAACAGLGPVRSTAPGVHCVHDRSERQGAVPGALPAAVTRRRSAAGVCGPWRAAGSRAVQNGVTRQRVPVSICAPLRTVVVGVGLIILSRGAAVSGCPTAVVV